MKSLYKKPTSFSKRESIPSTLKDKEPSVTNSKSEEPELPLKSIENTFETFNNSVADNSYQNSPVSKTAYKDQYAEMVSEHSNCFENQKNIVDNYKAQFELYSEDILSLRSEILRWQEREREYEEELKETKDKGSEIEREIGIAEETINSLKKEILSLQRKIENGHEQISEIQHDEIIIRKKLMEEKTDREILKSEYSREQMERCNLAQELNNELQRIQSQNALNQQREKESVQFEELVERMNDEIKLLKERNYQACEYISTAE